jgi:hypothetical protein
LPVAGAKGPFREVRVKVSNKSDKPVVVWWAEGGGSGYYHTGTQLTLKPNEGFVAKTGDYREGRLVIAFPRCGKIPEGLVFENPSIGFVSVWEVQRSHGIFWEPIPGTRAKEFHEGWKRSFWSPDPLRPGPVSVTRHGDSADFKEFTESILHHPCSR